MISPLKSVGLFRRPVPTIALIVALVMTHEASSAAAGIPDVSHGREMMLRTFELEVQQIETQWLEGVDSLADWEKRRVHLRRQLAEMLGLWPQPGKSDLEVQLTGRADHPDFTVHNLHFQSMPGLYVTANFYVPENVAGPVPAVLYLCGHANRVVDGVSYGSKIHYQHNPAWYARQGIACLIIDTLDRGEIPGLHHGTYSQGRWWWHNRGYSPTAVEAWNGIRSLDFLATRPEIDMSRIGVTGRSGGGMHSWLLMALDDRVSVATPAAGITDLRAHILEDAISGHCDCNYWNNHHRLDTTVMAALAAPRPALLLNTQVDPLFPTRGIRRIDERVAKVYSLYGKEDRWRVFIGSGGHEDSRELQMETFRWMHRWLKGEDLPQVPETEQFFENEQLRVLRELPKDERNSRIDEVFVAAAPEPDIPSDLAEWQDLKAEWMEKLENTTFAGWPRERAPEPELREVIPGVALGSLTLETAEFSPQDGLSLRLWILRSTDTPAERVAVRVLDHKDWAVWLAALGAVLPEQMEEILGPGARSVQWPEPDKSAFAGFREEILESGTALVVVAPRGVGPTYYEEDRPNRGDTLTRSFPMIGQTVDGIRVWDVRQALRASAEQRLCKLFPFTSKRLDQWPAWSFTRRCSTSLPLASS